MDKYGETGTYTVKTGLAQMLKGGVIMDVTSAEQAIIAEDAGAAAVMALERVPYDIRMDGGIARTAPVQTIKEIIDAVTIPVMAKARIGHYGEARILQNLEVDFVDESEVLSPADPEHHIYKHNFKIPFVCGARSLDEALRRINEGAAMIRTKGEPGTGDIKEAVMHMRAMRRDFALVIGYDLLEKRIEKEKRSLKREIGEKLADLEPEQVAYLFGMVELGKYYEETNRLNMDDELMAKLKEYELPMESMPVLKQHAERFLEIFGEDSCLENSIRSLAIEWGTTEDLVRAVAENKGLPVVNFAAGGIATPADAAHMMYLGADGVFVGSGIFKSKDPEKMAKAIVEATTQYMNIDELTQAQRDISGVEAMEGIEDPKLRMQERTT